MLKPIGFIAEHEFGKLKKEASAHDYKREYYEINFKTALLNYLKAGECFAIRLDVIKSIFPEARAIGSPIYYTDGVWIWPDYIIFYINEYNFQLSSEFINHIKKSNFTIPSIKRNKIDEAISTLDILQNV